MTEDEAGLPCIEIEQKAVNQDGELSAAGAGLLRPPSRRA